MLQLPLCSPVFAPIFSQENNPTKRCHWLLPPWMVDVISQPSKIGHMMHSIPPFATKVRTRNISKTKKSHTGTWNNHFLNGSFSWNHPKSLHEKCFFFHLFHALKKQVVLGFQDTILTCWKGHPTTKSCNLPRAEAVTSHVPSHFIPTKRNTKTRMVNFTKRHIWKTTWSLWRV